MTRLTKLWIGVTCALLSLKVFAGDIRNDCDNDPLACSSEVAELQRSQTKGSFEWWELEALRLDSLFKLQKNDELYAALRPWVKNTDVPEKYQPVLQLFLGKWLTASGRHEESQVALSKALSGFKEQYAATPSPSNGVRVLNLLVSLDRFEEASVFAEVLESSNFEDALFYREIFAELGHVAQQKNELSQHIDYRLKSLQWAKRVPDLQQQAIAHNNYGVALRESKKYIMAESAFSDALKCAKKANDTAHVNSIRLRLAEIAKHQNNVAKSKKWLDKVILDELPALQIPRYRKLVDALAE